MTARAAMIDQIIAYPDDDTLRLAHAIDLRNPQPGVSAIRFLVI